MKTILETAMVEAVPAVAGSGAAATHFGNVEGTDAQGGSEGVFHVVNTRGNVWSGGNPVALAGFDSVIQKT